ncbi:cyanoexosortase A [Chamaesiphon sp. VAR_48_metabat_135_sub]|uniref:cyanoexosortase A n=1 Tax=Chamaesiphon sp. VAR_48_metabat_135_sub TaxID=2964699 RepID=UPI00286BEBF4|nr:cyanoexosortase A [Chamaesiphon sp. VAR_48_metabat_135_sub]
MKEQAFFKRISLTSPAFLLIVLCAAIVAIHLTLIFKIGSPDRQITSMLFWATAGYLIWERQDKLNFQTGIVASLLGALLLSILLLKTAGYCEESFLIAYPFFSGIGLALIASGFRGLKVYGGELVLLFFSGIPEVLLAKLTDPSPLTAKFAASMLWYTGFPVIQKGIYLQLPGGSVQVYSGCSGVVAMTQLLGMSILFLMLLPLPWKWFQKLVVPIAAVAIGFIVNAMRVALMAILVSQKQMEAFEYWHTGSGSLIFSVIGTFLLVLLVWLLIKVFTPKLVTQEEPE